MKVWVVEERVYNLDMNGYRRLQSTDPIYLASSKELAIDFICDNKDDTENVFVADVYGILKDMSGEEGPEVEVAIYAMSVDKLDNVLEFYGDLPGKWYDCRTVEEWCDEQDLIHHNDPSHPHKIEIGGEG